MSTLMKTLSTTILALALAGCAAAPKPADSGIADASASASAAPPSAAPAAAATTEKPKRVQLKGTTDFAVSPEATKDSAFKTPLPKEYPDAVAYLPEGLIFRLPFDGAFKVSNGYGFESGSWTHQTISNTESANDFFALDFSMEVGTPILAPARGRIITSQDRTSIDSYGNYVVIDHGQGVHTVYAHLDKREFDVDHGNPEVWVEAGQKIGESGKSGTRWPHLHFGVHKDSRISESGCDVAGKTVCPEPLGGYYGIRKDHVLDAGSGK